MKTFLKMTSIFIIGLGMCSCATYDNPTKTVTDRTKLLVCDKHKGIKSWKGEVSHLVVTCNDGTVFNIEWL